MNSKMFVMAMIINAFFSAPALANSAQDQVGNVDLHTVGLSCHMTVVGPEVEGRVKNVSGSEIKNVIVHSSFYASNNQFISNGENGISFDPILPGQTSNFHLFGGKNPDITKVKISFGIIFGPELSSSGQKAVSCTPRRTG